MSAGDCGYVRTMQIILSHYGIDATVCSGNAHDHQSVIDILNSGRGIMIYVGPKYENMYTKNTAHWITIADIRNTELGSEMGYDIYALTSNNGKGHGWHPIETVLNNLKAGQFYYIDDGENNT